MRRGKRIDHGQGIGDVAGDLRRRLLAPGMHVFHAGRQHRRVAQGIAEIHAVQAVEAAVRQVGAIDDAAVVPRLDLAEGHEPRRVDGHLQRNGLVGDLGEVGGQGGIDVGHALCGSAPAGQRRAVAAAAQYAVADVAGAGVGQAQRAPGQGADFALGAVLAAVAERAGRAGQARMDGGVAHHRVVGALQQVALRHLAALMRGVAQPAREQDADDAEDHQGHGQFDQREAALARAGEGGGSGHHGFSPARSRVRAVSRASW